MDNSDADEALLQYSSPLYQLGYHENLWGVTLDGDQTQDLGFIRSTL
jgi:hypothetical protein